MNKRTFWILAIVICLGLAIWGLGFGLGGCSSTLQGVTESTGTSTTTSTSMSTTTTLALVWSGIKQIDGTGVETLLSDADGNIYAVGGTQIGLDGNAYLGGTDAYLIKFDPAGNKKWTRQFGTSAEENLTMHSFAARDNDGNIYITGTTYGSFESYTNAGGSDIFLVKYDSNGNKQWVKQFGDSSNDFESNVAVDTNGNIYLAGNTTGGFDGNAHIGGQDFFLMKLNSSGSKQWTKQFGTSLWDNVNAVKTDSAGNIYIAGTFIPEVGISVMDVYLMKCDPDGNMLWKEQFGTGVMDIGKSIAIDSHDNIYLAGMSGTPFGDLFLAKYDPSGARQWMKEYATSGDDRCQAVVIDPSGNLYLGGETKGAFAGYTNAGDFDIFLMKTDPDGNEIWTRQLGTDDEDYCSTAVTDPSGNVFIGGNSTKGLDASNPHDGAYLIKFNPAGNRQ